MLTRLFLLLLFAFGICYARRPFFFLLLLLLLVFGFISLSSLISRGLVKCFVCVEGQARPFRDRSKMCMSRLAALFVVALLVTMMTAASVESVCVTTNSYTYAGNMDYSADAFHVFRVSPSTYNWNSDLNFTDFGTVDATSGYDWTSCTSGITLYLTPYRSATAWATTVATSVTASSVSYAFTSSAVAWPSTGGTADLVLECVGTGLVIRFVQFYTIANCGLNGPTITTGLVVNPSIIYPWTIGSVGAHMVVSGSNLLRCDKSITWTVGGILVDADTVVLTDTSMTAAVPTLTLAGSYPVVIDFGGYLPHTDVVGNVTVLPAKFPQITSDRLGTPVSAHTFDSTTGGSLTVYGTDFQVATASDYVLRSRSDSHYELNCTTIQRSGTELVCAVPASNQIADIRYLGAFDVVLVPVFNAVLTSNWTHGILLAYNYDTDAEYIESLPLVINFTGPWSSPVYMATLDVSRKGDLTQFLFVSPDVWSFTGGGAYAGTPAAILSTPLPSRFRPAVAHSCPSGDLSGAVYLTVGADGVLSYTTAAGGPLTFSPSLDFAPCAWAAAPDL